MCIKCSTAAHARLPQCTSFGHPFVQHLIVIAPTKKNASSVKNGCKNCVKNLRSESLQHNFCLTEPPPPAAVAVNSKCNLLPQHPSSASTFRTWQTQEPDALYRDQLRALLRARGRGSLPPRVQVKSRDCSRGYQPSPRYGIQMCVHHRYRSTQSRIAKQKSTKKALRCPHPPPHTQKGSIRGLPSGHRWT